MLSQEPRLMNDDQSVHVCTACAFIIESLGRKADGQDSGSDPRSGWPLVRLKLADVRDLTKRSDLVEIEGAKSKYNPGQARDAVLAQSARCSLDRSLDRLAQLWLTQEAMLRSTLQEDPDVYFFQDSYLHESLACGYTCPIYPGVNAPDEIEPREKTQILADIDHESLQIKSVLRSWVRRPVWPDPIQPRSLYRIQEWLDECESSHHRWNCKGPISNRLPARLLELRDEDVCLIQTASLKAPVKVDYIALSHCWGRAQPCRLLQENISALEKGIDLASLPRTFRDAITLTRELRIKYLWIDSLCIIQDDADDWREEAARMADVYSNALLTVSAARAHGDDEGFLKLRKSSCVTVQIDFPNEKRTEFFLAPVMPSAERLSGLQDPIDTRAWTFQEALLSQRLLRFHRDETSFMCQSKGATSPRRHGGMVKLESRCERELQHDLPIQQGLIGIIGSLNQSESNDSWQNIIKLYLDRRLTLEKDRLPALAGLAKRVAQGTEGSKYRDLGEYLAGMWTAQLGQSNFCESLLWRPEQPIVTTMQTPSTTQDNFLPSWSYLRACGPIELYPEQWKRKGGMLWPAQFKGANMQPLGPDPYGELRSGYIIVYSMIVLLHNGNLARDSEHHPHRLSAHFLLDSEGDVPRTALGIFIKWVEGQEDEAENIWGSAGRGLLLQEVPDDPASGQDSCIVPEQILEADIEDKMFRRIGLFETLPMDFKDWVEALNANELWVNVKIT